eukprot:TRINITY_DN5969_c0_g1_i1.p1 TRINITY_DN5969_c0_g1~~TRINITY_DN5969_c0_g1_i1.p1  ORF type:complete len:222 (+),score=20.37 TRINITY_DN5969_c0_g1_i1:49-714(+)
MGSMVFAPLVSGVLHGLTGPDHLTAILPLSVNKGIAAWKYGFQWGLGHGIGMVAFGFLVYLFKSLVPFNVEALAKWLDLAVGVSLILVGGMGLREVNYEKRKKQSMLPLHFNRGVTDHKPKESVSLMTGIWQGFTGSGHFVGVMPALTLPSLMSAILYLLLFCSGTAIAMAAFSGIVGEVSKRVTDKGSTVNPLQLAYFASWFSVAIGILMFFYGLINLWL